MRQVRFVLGVAAMTLIALCGSASAQTATAQSCLGDQLRASATICKGYARCYALAMQSGNAVDPVCFGERAQRLESLFTDIEDLALGVCLVEGADPDVASMIAAGVDPMAASLTLTGGHCASRKIGALGKECSGYLRCYAKAAAHSSSVDPACLASYQQRLARNFDKVEAKGQCVTTGDRAAMEAMVDSTASSIFVLLRGTDSTTTSTTSTSTSSTWTTTTTTTTTTIPATTTTTTIP